MAVDYYRSTPIRRDTVEMEAVGLITVRNLDDGRCLGFFPSTEAVLLAVAKSGIDNWVAEQRHPTLDEIEQVFARDRAGAFNDEDVWKSVRRRDP